MAILNLLFCSFGIVLIRGATYIAEIFQENVNEFNFECRNTDFIFFDDLSNFQKKKIVSKLSLGIILPWWQACPVPPLH